MSLKLVNKIVGAGSNQLRQLSDSRRSRRYPDSIFVWIPKTGGTSVYTMLRDCGFVKLKSVRDVRTFFGSKGRVTFGHMSIAALMDEGIVAREFIENALKFTVVRNPYSRAVSCYNHMRKRGYLDEWIRQPSFTQFLELIASGFIERLGTRNNLRLSFCNPQAQWLRQIELEHVFHLESLADDLPKLARLLECPGLSLGHTNRSSGVRLQDLTMQDRLLVEQIYREDFDRFGYERVLPQGIESIAGPTGDVKVGI